MIFNALFYSTMTTLEALSLSTSFTSIDKDFLGLSDAVSLTSLLRLEGRITIKLVNADTQFSLISGPQPNNGSEPLLDWGYASLLANTASAFHGKLWRWAV